MKILTVPADKAQLDRVIAFVDEALESAPGGMELQFRVELAVEEAFVNIANYAYAPGSGQVEVGCEFQRDSGRFVIRFADAGKAFNPLARAEADTSAKATMEREGGLGILLVKKTMDDVRYARENGKNILTLTKKL